MEQPNAPYIEEVVISPFYRSIVRLIYNYYEGIKSIPKEGFSKNILHDTAGL
jgi:hypothetical protein